MQFTNAHREFRLSLRDLLDREVLPHIDEWEERAGIPRRIWSRLAEMNCFGLCLPKAYGGRDLDFAYQVIFIEEVSRCWSGGFAASIIAHPILALTHINASGSERLKEKYLRPGIAGARIGALAITEPGAGSDVAAIRTCAVRADGGYRIQGAKTFITNGLRSDFLVVAAKTRPDAGAAGISLLLVDRQSEGLSARSLQKLGWHASDTAEIALEDVWVPEENLIGEENAGFYYIMQRFALERLVMALSAIASCEQVLEYTIGHLRQRQAFGRSLTGFQELRHRLAQLAADIERTKAFNYQCALAFSSGTQPIKTCAMAKLLATQLSDRVMTECLQFLGGKGCLETYPLARMFRDSRLGTIGGGTSEIMCEIIAREVIDGGLWKK